MFDQNAVDVKRQHSWALGIFVLPQNYIISFKNPLKIRWDVFILILACVNGIVIPINLAFKPEELQWAVFVVFNNLVDFLFFIDIVLILMTSYLDIKTGQEVKDQKLIAL